MATTGAKILKTAMGMIGVLDLIESPDAAQGQNGLIWLNLMMGSLSLQPQTIGVFARDTFAMVANQSSYTVGVGGDFNIQRPSDIGGMSLILTNSQPNPVEVPLAKLTDDGYESIQVKSLTNSQPTCFYYRPTFPLGTLILWPVPNVGYNELAMYRNEQLRSFTSLLASYELPDGLELVLVSNLAVYLSTVYTVPVSDVVKDTARNSLAVFKRNNVKMTDMPQDMAITNSHRGTYNINTGTGG